MCDYSLTNVKSRPAKVGDILKTANFGTGTRGFSAPTDDAAVAVCVLPGTEIAFDKNIEVYSSPVKTLQYNTAIFRQVNKDQPNMHHDALELPSGETMLLTLLTECQTARVLQLPAPPKTKKEAEEQKRVENFETASAWSFR